MLGIILTLFAVLLVICFAFYYSEHPSGLGPRNDALLSITSRGLKKNPDRDTGTKVNRQ
jgi:hypothetical protein